MEHRINIRGLEAACYSVFDARDYFETHFRLECSQDSAAPAVSLGAVSADTPSYDNSRLSMNLEASNSKKVSKQSLVIDEAETTTGPATQRLFLGLPVPEHVVESVRAASTAYLHCIERNIAPEKWHLTLLFLDEVENPKQYYSRLRKPLPQSFVPTVRLTHLGRGRKRTQVWAYAEASAVLGNIRQQLLKRLTSMRFPVPPQEKTRQFVPHITVAHLFESVGGVGLADVPLLTSFSAKEALLYRSTLAPEGSHYTVEERIPLLSNSS